MRRGEALQCTANTFRRQVQLNTKRDGYVVNGSIRAQLEIEPQRILLRRQRLRAPRRTRVSSAASGLPPPSAADSRPMP